MPERSIAHTKWDCTYHIVMIPKYRRKVLYGGCREELKEIIRKLLERIGIEIVEGAMCIDHVHMSLRIPPKYSVSYVMGYVKGKSALKLYEEKPELRSQTGKARTLWARGYYVSTVGLNEEVVRKYIREQEASDQFGDEMR